jgi:hypothetical protein
METLGEAAGPAPVLRFACPACGRKYATKPGLAGKKIRCKGCGGGVLVPRDDPTSLTQPRLPGTTAGTSAHDATDRPRPVRDRATRADVLPGAGDGPVDSSSLLDELASHEGVKRSGRAGTVLPSRSEAMEQVRQKVAEQEAVEARKKAEKVKQKKKRKRRAGDLDPKETLTLVGGVAALVAFLAFLAWGYPDLRFPLGGLLCLIGFVVYLLGAFSLRQLVAEEGPLQALLFRFCPPYQWWFVATRWAEAKEFFAFFAAGLVILAIGSAIIKTSAIGKKAEESERAYQELSHGGRTEVPPAVPKRVDEDGN